MLVLKKWKCCLSIDHRRAFQMKGNFCKVYMCACLHNNSRMYQLTQEDNFVRFLIVFYQTVPLNYLLEFSCDIYHIIFIGSCLHISFSWWSVSFQNTRKKISFFTIPNFVLVPDKYRHLANIHGMHKLCEGLLSIDKMLNMRWKTGVVLVLREEMRHV